VIGALAALGTALGYAVSALLLKARFSGYDGRGVTGLTTAIAALLLLPAALATFPGSMPSGDALGSLVVLGIASTAGGFLLFFRLQVEVGPGRASVVAYLAPGIAVVLGVAFLGDPFGASTVAGLALILLGSLLAGRRAGLRLRPRLAGSTSGP
jgi:drug/metabolite transporter (DMT)-like permease